MHRAAKPEKWKIEMNGSSAAVQGMSFQAASIILALLVSVNVVPNANGQAGRIENFHDDAFDITYFYSGDFSPVPLAAPSDGQKCIRTTFVANSAAPSDPSSFTLSTIDHTCPEVLRNAAELGPFTRAQLLVQLKQYGAPTITQAPSAYTIAGHPAAVSLASVAIPAAPGKVAQTIYAAKACALGNAAVKNRKKSEPVEPETHVVCIDFTTQSTGLPSQMFSFIIQFGSGPLEPVFPGNVVRKLGGTYPR
jgi:hypothetical protein